MAFKKNRIIFLLLLLIAFFVKWYSSNSNWVEAGYAHTIYPKIGYCLRLIFGWLPFSIGDILYGLAFLWLLFKLIKGVKNSFQKKITSRGQGKSFSKGIFILLCTYLIFTIFWGINYNRKGIAYQFNLTKDSITKQDVVDLNLFLVKQVNETKLSLLLAKSSYPSNQQLFTRVENAYKKLDSIYPFLTYEPKSIKTSMWGWLVNYTGFTGYYNPFTGEAQVNTTVPKFIQPFTTCHEVGHQLGYAKESEANFVAFLAAIHSNDSLLLYSTYLNMFLYTNRNVGRVDTAAAKMAYKALIPQVKEDIATWQKFNASHQSFMEPIVRWGYGFYLKQNNQPQGLLSYDAVTHFLVLYYKKYGTLYVNFS